MNARATLSNRRIIKENGVGKVCLHIFIVVTHLYAIIATNCLALTRYMNGSCVLGQEREVLLVCFSVSCLFYEN
jgi:hypothetical protein